MKILFVGVKDGTSLQRSKTLSRLGHDVTHVNFLSHVPGGRWVKKFHRETGGLFSEKTVTEGVAAEIRSLDPSPHYDMVWVENGRYVGPSLIKHLRGFSEKVISYNLDDPYGNRDRYSWALYRKTIPHYDMVVVVRPVNVGEAKARGAKDAMLVIRGADELAHTPRVLDDAIRQKWASDVLFVGTWFPERGPFMTELISLGVPLTLFGANWHKAREWPQLQPYWKGTHLEGQDDYAYAIQCSRVALGLLSKGNRDLHTQRSSEVPALGALFCAERTTEHVSMYDEGAEAVFWADAKECAKVCKDLLADEPKRVEIAARGRARVDKNRAWNEMTLAAILERAFNPDAPDGWLPGVNFKRFRDY